MLIRLPFRTRGRRAYIEVDRGRLLVPGLFALAILPTVGYLLARLLILQP